LGISSHYFNQLPDGSEIDLTESQFSKDTLECIKKYSPKQAVRREDVLSNLWTFERYKILKEKVEKFLRLERIRKTIE